jgi:starch synthase (maltosyl-transferring)
MSVRTQSNPRAPEQHVLPDLWSRVYLVSVSPSVDDGRWPIQRSQGEEVEVEAGVIVDGHEKLAVELLFAYEDEDPRYKAMQLRWNDEYLASFPVEKLGMYRYKVRAWMDRFATWQDQFKRRVDGGAEEPELRTELLDGAAILRRAASGAPNDAAARLERTAKRMEEGHVAAGLEFELAATVRKYAPRDGLVESGWLWVRVDPPLARFGAWYEFFPRSAGDEPGQHTTLDEAAERLVHVRNLGFDIVYLPPVHPIGTTFRKGKDNNPVARPDEPGSPWAIGSDAGGHKSVHPDLGGIEAFDRFVERASELDLAVAIDIAFQTSPDHPYVSEHPEWFQHRPDGTIRYAENPPKKYQDVYPLDFEGEQWRELWLELKNVFEFWIGHGVKIFRVDNPHTKPFAFWEWCIASLRREYPDTIFLAEAFSRPKTMYTLAKLGFNNSYTYFTWRDTKKGLTEYCEELFHSPIGDFFRPNFWPNTPDILSAYLASGGRAAHEIRFILAATLSSAYGLYGPPYEHLDNIQHPAREEYANNEKYEVRAWNWNDPDSLQPLIRRVNRIRRDNPALQYMRNIRFLDIENPNLIAYAKEKDDNLVVCVVNLDPFNTHSGWISLPLEELGLPVDEPFDAQDLLGGDLYRWSGSHNFVSLDPAALPAHIIRIPRTRRTQSD